MPEEPILPEPEENESIEPVGAKKKRSENRDVSFQLAPEVIEDLKRRYGVEDEPPTEIEPEPITFSPPPKPIENVVIDTVGQISPLLLGLGVISGLLLFVLLTAGIIYFILYAGILPGPLPSEPVAETFDAGSSEYWGEWLLEGELDDNGETNVLQEARFTDGGYYLVNGQPDALFWTSAGLRLGAGIYEVDITFQTVDADTGAGIAVLLDSDRFFLFEIDPNGYTWIGLCEADCTVAQPLTGGGWYATDPIDTDFDATNRLKLSVKRGQLIAYVNDVEVGFVSNESVAGAGDIAFVVEAGEMGETAVLFDNFLWSPHP